MTEVPIIQKPVCSANKLTGFYLIGTSVMNELIIVLSLCITSLFSRESFFPENHFKGLLQRQELIKSSEYSKGKGQMCFINMRSRAD